MRRHSGIAGRLTAIYLVVAVPLVVVIALVYGEWYGARLRAVELERAGRAEQAAVAFQLLLTDMLGTMRTEGQRLAIGNRGAEDVAAELRRFEDVFPFAYVAFTDRRGRVAESSDPAVAGEDFSGEPAFMDALTSERGDGIEPSARHDGRPTGFHVSTRVEDGEGRLLGVMISLVDVRRLGTTLDRALAVRTGGVSIIDSAGHVVYQNEEPRLAQQITNWNRYPWVQQALRGQTGTTARWRFPLDGQRRIGVFVPISEIEWAAGSSVGFDQALAAFYRSLLFSLPLTTAVILIAVLVGFVLAARIGGALETLSSDAQRIGLGDLDHRVRSERRDEIGEVSRSLEEARLNLRRQSEATSSLLRSADVLAQWTNLEEVLDRLGDVLASSLPGVRAWILLCHPVRPEIRLVASAGREPHLTGTVFGLDELSDPTRRVMAERKTAVVDYDVLPDGQRGLSRDLGMRLVLLVPITRESRLAGVIAVDAPRQRREFAEDEIRLVEGIASQAAIAIESGRLYDAERERAARLGALREIAGLVASSLRSDEVVERAVESVVRHRGVAATSVWILDERRERLMLAGAAGFPDEFSEDFQDGIGMDEPFDVARAVRERRPIVHEDADRSDVSGRVKAAYDRYGIRLASLVVMPLMVPGRVIGALTEAWSDQRHFEPEDLSFAAALANTFASALDNARLYEQSQEVARLGEALNRVDDAVHSTLRAEEVLRQVLVAAGEGLGCDSSSIALLEDGAWVPRYVWNLPSEILGTRFKPEDVPFVRIAAETKRPVAVDDAMNDPRASHEVQERWGIPSVLVTPLTSRDGLMGALFFNYHSPHRYSEPETDFAIKVASSASLALENARLYENEHFVAETLQETLLALPERIPGLEFAHAYHSASEVARVGGDFYDLFDLQGGDVGITVGDISGKGIEAAMLTSLVKNTIRAQATEGERTPSEVVRVASNVMLKWSPADMFATVFFGVFDAAAGRLAFCNAGHTTGAILRNAGEPAVEALEATSPLVGALSGLEFRDATASLAVGDTLFLYTDGLTEARAPDGELYDESRLFGLLESFIGMSPEEIVRAVVAEVVAFAGGHLSDDLAILALRPAGE